MRNRYRALILPALASLVFLRSEVFAQGLDDESDAFYYRFPREQRDLELRPIAPDLRFGFQIGGSAYRQKQSGVKEKDSSIDGLDLEFLYEVGEQLEFQMVVNYEFDGSKRILFEETFARYEIFEDGPWYVEGGRMEMPLGEYNSNFVEDPITQTLGETFDGALILGYEQDDIEIAIAGFKGDFEKTNALVAVNLSSIENLEAGVYWSSNVGESMEMREIQKEALMEEEEGELFTQPVMGIGGFVAWDLDPFLIDFEYVAAIESFRPGLLDDEAFQPRAWNFEVAVTPLDRWQFAARLESSKYLPDNPKWQYGMAASYGILENLIITANYLRAEYREEPSKRNLLQVELIFEY